MILLCLSKKDVAGATVDNTYGMSVENTVKFLSGGKMFVKES